MAFHLEIPFKNMKIGDLVLRNLCHLDATNMTFFLLDYHAKFGPAKFASSLKDIQVS